MLATGLEDGDAGVEADRALTGEALRPPSPVHLRATRTADGAITVSWVRRSRSGWRWLDGADAPIGEELERYRIELRSEAGSVRSVELLTASFLYDAETQAADGVGGPVSIEVMQLGTFASSRAARLTVA